MKTIFLILSVFMLACAAACSQNAKPALPVYTNVGGRCEGCEAVLESPVPFEQLNWIDTLPDFEEAGEKIEISGVIYKPDGLTPAPDVVMYVYHTDQKGLYSQKNDARGWAKRHGYIQGWIKTNEKGEYRFLTLRPKHYPDSSIPEHIHPTIKEADKNEYYIDDFTFEDDPLMSEVERARQPLRGGSGIVTFIKNTAGTSVGKRNIVLGLNIPDYPK